MNPLLLNLRPLLTVEPRKRKPTSLSWSILDPQNFICGFADGTVFLWNVFPLVTATAELEIDPSPLAIYRGNTAGDSVGRTVITDVSFSPFNQYLFATCTVGGDFYIWDLRVTSSPLYRSSSASMCMNMRIVSSLTIFLISPSLSHTHSLTIIHTQPCCSQTFIIYIQSWPSNEPYIALVRESDSGALTDRFELAIHLLPLVDEVTAKFRRLFASGAELWGLDYSCPDKFGYRTVAVADSYGYVYTHKLKLDKDIAATSSAQVQFKRQARLAEVTKLSESEENFLLFEGCTSTFIPSQTVRVERSTLTSLHVLRWNPNKDHGDWMAFGGMGGYFKCHSVV